MSNEELAARIKAGERELISQLWEQTRGFIAQQAARRIYALNGAGGVELDDLIQSGFFALLQAVEDYDQEREYKLLTYLGYHLKTEFASCIGYRTRAGLPMIKPVSLDTPLDDNDPGSETLLDQQADPADRIKDVEHQIWIEQLQSVLMQAMGRLPSIERQVLICRYLEQQTQAKTAEIVGCSLNLCRQSEYRAFKHLRRPSIVEELRPFVEECINNNTRYYYRVGLKSFENTHTSAVEKLTLEREELRRLYREQLKNRINQI